MDIFSLYNVPVTFYDVAVPFYNVAVPFYDVDDSATNLKKIGLRSLRESRDALYTNRAHALVNYDYLVSFTTFPYFLLHTVWMAPGFPPADPRGTIH